MLIEFSVANFRSFREIQTLRLQAASIKSKNPQIDEQNTFLAGEKLHLVKSKVIYGPNASGKSNLIRAVTTFFMIFRQSLQDVNILQRVYAPFLLDVHAFKEPTFFQIQFQLENRNYRYGFEADATEIISEWLFSSDGNGVESYHFKRSKDDIEVNKRTFKEAARLLLGKGEMPPLYRENALFLPLVAAFNGPLASKIDQYFRNYYAAYNGADDRHAAAIAAQAVKNESMRLKIAEVLKRSDMGIEDLGVRDIPEDMLNNEAKEIYQKKAVEGDKPVAIVTTRRVKNEQGADIDVHFLMSEESFGTQKMFWLSPFLIGILENGGVLIIDEFGSSLHHRLIDSILQLFHSRVTNPHNAQLIVATHDTHLLDQRKFRRDQIVFVEKNREGQSVLTDLVEFKGVRNDASLENDYLQGRYGAIPFVNQFDWAFTPENYEQTSEIHQEN
ncbi:MAG: ATP-binding protein [Saprospiraceae bacterium]|nr:ATP-binding protein [Saprospiraceae bacterium]